MTTTSATLPAATRSSAYERMRAENPAEFEPRSVFLGHDGDCMVDWYNSFRVKAALVYEVVTNDHVAAKTMPDAWRLLLDLAKECDLMTSKRPSPATGQTPTGGQTPVANDGKQEPASATNDQERQKAIMKAIEEEVSKLHDGQRTMVDAIFLAIGFLPSLKKEVDGKKPSREGVDDHFVSTHTQDIVTDMVKIKNQLPLVHVHDVLDHIDKVTLPAGPFKKDRLPNKDSLPTMIQSFCWYYSPFYTKEAKLRQHVQEKLKDKEALKHVTLLDLLHMSLQSVSVDEASASGKTQRMPAAKELRRSGVRFEADEAGRAEISFKEPALSMPALVFDFKLATVARNLLAWEAMHEQQRKPVTRYFQLMNELVVDARDVRVIARAGVVRGGTRQEVFDLLKKIDGCATYPSVCMAMDHQIENVKRFHEKRMKSFFVRNRPGVIWVSSVAAVSVVAIVAARKRHG